MLLVDQIDSTHLDKHDSALDVIEPAFTSFIAVERLVASWMQVQGLATSWMQVQGLAAI